MSPCFMVISLNFHGPERRRKDLALLSTFCLFLQQPLIQAAVQTLGEGNCDFS
jgi:hypothetical protein